MALSREQRLFGEQQSTESHISLFMVCKSAYILQALNWGIHFFVM